MSALRQRRDRRRRCTWLTPRPLWAWLRSTQHALLSAVLGLALWGVFSAPCQAQIPQEWLGLRVVALEIAGEEEGRVDLRSLSIPIGAELTRGLVRDAIVKLGESGRWADIQVDARRSGPGVVLSFRLSPTLMARRVDVLGNDVLADREVLRLVGTREGGEIDESLFPDWIAEVRKAYEEHGHYSASIRITLRDTEVPAEKVVRIEVEEGPPTLISEIQFVGDRLPKRKGLGRVLRFSEGDVLDMEQIKNDLLKAEEILRKAGYYAAVLSEPKIERNELRARVSIPSAIGPHFEVRFRGHAPLEQGELFEAMKLGQERFSGETSMYALESRLIDVYRRYGFRDPKVTIRAHELPRLPGASREDSAVALDVDIEPGTQTEILRISFPGAKHFSDELLREQIYSYLEEDLPGSAVRSPVDSDVADRLGYGGGKRRAARGVDKPMLQDPRRLYYEPTYESALEHIRDLYRADGFLSIQVDPPLVENLPESGKAVISVSIVEGPRTFIYDVRVEGNDQVPSYQILEAAQLERGTPFSYLRLEEARVRVSDAYQEQGYFYATVEPHVRTSEDGTRAEVVFEVVERFLVRVGSIQVEGAERTSRRMVKDRVVLREGEIFRPSAARKTQEALLSLDVFTSVSITPEQVDLPARVKNVVVTVVERKTQYLGWNAGFSTGEGVRGGFEYGYRNLFGSAVHASFRGQLGYQFVFLDEEIERNYEQLRPSERIEYQATLTTGIPYIPSFPKNSVTVDLVSLQDIQRDFRMQKQSVVATLFYRPIRRANFSVAEELESTYFELLADKALNNATNLGGTQNIVPFGQNALASTQLNASWDLRDRSYNPTKGLFLSLSSEWARTIDSSGQDIVDCPAGTSDDECEEMTRKEFFTSNLLRFVASAAFYLPLGKKVVFANLLRYGRIVHIQADSRSYPNRRFYLGGTNFRGYYQNQVIPADLKDVDPENIISHGGDTFISLQSELRFPLYRELYGGLFTDIGNVWADPKALNFKQLLTVVGAGLRFQTPVASLALDYGIRAVDTQPFDIVGAFQFAFQTF